MKPSTQPVLAIVGGDTLLGRELRELIKDRKFDAQLKLITGTEELPATKGNEPIPVETILPEELVTSRVILLAGGAESSQKAWTVLPAEHPPLVDLTGALEDEPSARLRAPFVEPASYIVPKETLHVIAHPAAIALAMFFTRLAKKYKIRASVVQIFEPASERGQAGLNELQQQTVGLLSFKPLNKAVFDVQASFNMLPRYGEEAPQNLADIEARIDRHLASLLERSGIQVPMPSLRLVQAPVFHGYSFSIWVEFEDNPGVQAAGEALATAQIEVRADSEEPPSNVGVAGQSGLTTGSIVLDRNNPRACWFWAVADNLRVSGENAVEVIEQFL